MPKKITGYANEYGDRYATMSVQSSSAISYKALKEKKDVCLDEYVMFKNTYGEECYAFWEGVKNIAEERMAHELKLINKDK